MPSLEHLQEIHSFYLATDGHVRQEAIKLFTQEKMLDASQVAKQIVFQGELKADNTVALAKCELRGEKWVSVGQYEGVVVVLSNRKGIHIQQ
jgi:hypothetical protein